MPPKPSFLTAAEDMVTVMLIEPFPPSEFSLQKIKKAIEIAKSDSSDPKSIEEAHYIAACTGDRLIRTKLLEMLGDAEIR